eukprot:15438160-Alexandrium_andersonii.AAC.1
MPQTSPLPLCTKHSTLHCSRIVAAPARETLKHICAPQLATAPARETHNSALLTPRHCPCARNTQICLARALPPPCARNAQVRLRPHLAAAPARETLNQ